MTKIDVMAQKEDEEELAHVLLLAVAIQGLVPYCTFQITLNCLEMFDIIFHFKCPMCLLSIHGLFNLKRGGGYTANNI